MTGIAHLYLHVPFCRSRCPYCDYAVTTLDAPELGGWVGAVGGELRLRGGSEILATPLETLHIGGGTPSALGERLSHELRALLGENRLQGIGEWAVEANPEDLSRELLATWITGGVTRVNVGVQSMDSAVLKWLGRRHDAEGAREAIEALRECGAASWGIDLLYGLPMEVDPAPERSVEAALRLGVPHLSLYELVAEPGTPLGEAVRTGKVRPAESDRRADQYLALANLLERAGYEGYEMNAFALPGHASRHLHAVLSGARLLGLGPAAHSRIGGLARGNLRDWRDYSGTVAAGKLPDATEGGFQEGRLESWASRLRLREGVPLGEFTSSVHEVARRWMAEGWAHPDRGRLCLTREGWLRLDTLLLQLDAADGASR